jgi:hypothetical protein
MRVVILLWVFILEVENIACMCDVLTGSCDGKQLAGRHVTKIWYVEKSKVWAEKLGREVKCRVKRNVVLKDHELLSTCIVTRMQGLDRIFEFLFLNLIQGIMMFLMCR